MSAKNQTKSREGEIPFHLDTKFTVAEAAKELKRSTRTIRDWIKERELGAYRLGHALIITGSQMDAFADKRKLKMVHSMLRDPYEMSDFDPAFEPPKPIKINIADLTDKQLNAAIFLPPNFERFDTSVSKLDATTDQDFDDELRRWFRDWLEGKTDE